MRILLLLLCLPAFANTVTVINPEGLIISCPVGSVTGPSEALIYRCAIPPTPPNPPGYCPSSLTALPGPNSSALYPAPLNGVVTFKVPKSYAKSGQAVDASAGYIQVIQAPNTPPAAQFTIWFSLCPGVEDSLIQQTQTNQFGAVRKPCKQTVSYVGGPIYWSWNGGSVNVCNTPKDAYVNVKATGCVVNGQTQPLAECPLLLQWNPN